jgi:predicted LPLAT superfamily acyltransferase/GT2 family glycosyltransferase
MKFRPCCVIPSRNHHRVVGDVVRRVRAAGLPVLLIDDASDEPAAGALARLHAPGVTVVRLAARAGKGGAVITGMERAHAAGFSHVLQVDADGQHDLDHLPEMLRLAAERPDAVISGAALYDASVPAARRYGRYATHVWVWIETLSFQLTDTMCGFRIYPLAPVMALLRTEPVGRFMDFDTEVLVRLFWRGVPVRMVPVRVVYPEDNSSNFELWRDNWRITRMHTRLFFTMLTRLPAILANRRGRVSAEGRRAQPGHWATLGERGEAWGIRFLAWCYLGLGRTACRAVMLPVVLYFYLTDTQRRRASREFLTLAFAAGGWPQPPSALDVFRHFLDFAEKVLETFAAWTGGIGPSRVRTDHASLLAEAQASGSGALLIVSHLGNVDLSRALLDGARRARLTVLVHTRDAERYNRILRRFQPDAALNLLQVTEIGPETAIVLEERVARGEWIAIAGDRTPVGGGGRVSQIPFLGRKAPFSAGPYVLAHLLGCPVYLLFCLREKGGYRLYFERFAERIELPRGAARGEALAAHARRYASRLADLALIAPFQWYNFFDFWNQ